MRDQTAPQCADPLNDDEDNAIADCNADDVSG